MAAASSHAAASRQQPMGIDAHQTCSAFDLESSGLSAFNISHTNGPRLLCGAELDLRQMPICNQQQLSTEASRDRRREGAGVAEPPPPKLPRQRESANSEISFSKRLTSALTFFNSALH